MDERSSAGVCGIIIVLSFFVLGSVGAGKPPPDLPQVFFRLRTIPRVKSVHKLDFTVPRMKLHLKSNFFPRNRL